MHVAVVAQYSDLHIGAWHAAMRICLLRPDTSKTLALYKSFTCPVLTYMKP